MSHNLNYEDILTLKIQSVENWIYRKCKDLILEHKKYSDFQGFFNHVTRKHYNNIKSVEVNWIDVTDTIIVMLNYNDKKPSRVYFVETQKIPTAHDYYKDKVVYDFTKIKIK